MRAHAPPVSICIPTYNAERWIVETIGSALAQTYEDFELLVVDNASTDGTVDVVRSVDDPRIRCSVNRMNVGLVRNHNRCIELARGRLIKFLHADDLLYPECVAKMVPPLEASDRVGLVFAPRDVLLEDPEDVVARRWKARFGVLHGWFGELSSLNSGPELFGQWLADDLKHNWIGEQTAVMVRRECFERLGGFNVHLLTSPDAEMWARILNFYDAAFIDEVLSAHRHHSDSETWRLLRAGEDALERVWFMEGLLRYPEIRRRYPRLRQLRRFELARALKGQAKRLAVGHPQLRALADYVAYRGGAFLGKAPPLHG